jgi:hypothetical protein
VASFYFALLRCSYSTFHGVVLLAVVVLKTPENSGNAHLQWIRVYFAYRSRGVCKHFVYVLSSEFVRLHCPPFLFLLIIFPSFRFGCSLLVQTAVLWLSVYCLREQVPRPPLHFNRQWGDIKTLPGRDWEMFMIHFLITHFVYVLSSEFVRLHCPPFLFLLITFPSFRFGRSLLVQTASGSQCVV